MKSVLAWILLVVLCSFHGAVGAETSVSSKDVCFSDYLAAYTERMAKAKDDAEVAFLTERYDGALKKMQSQLAATGKTADAKAVEEERERIRKLERVVASGVFAKESTKGAKAPVEKETTKPSSVTFFGIEQTCSRPVFLLMAGPAASSNRGNSDLGKMTVPVVLNRMAEAINALPAAAEFNAALFWYPITTPMAPEMLAASAANKATFSEWAATVNPPESSMAYGNMPTKTFAAKFSGMKWPQRLAAEVGSGWPKWVYDYQPSEAVAACCKAEPMHLAKALCFAFEQKADAVFVFTSNFVTGSYDPVRLQGDLEDVAKSTYGSDRKKWPAVNVVLLDSSEGSSTAKEALKSVLHPFESRIELVADLEKFMTEAEKDRMESL